MTADTERWPRYAAATALERELGDPRDARNPLGFAAAAGRDADESRPHALAAQAGPRLRTAFVPAALGGTMEALDATLMLVRTAARRDAAIMPATMFGITAATCVLIAGSPGQREHVVRLLRQGGSLGFALSEADHGSDLLANDTRAEEVAGGYALTGEKWLVGLGGGCDGLLVVARTGGRGPAAFSALLLDGEQAAAARRGTRRPTGMRGADLAGFRFDGLTVPRDALVGGVGRGLETAMKAMQVVRTMSTAASLACADTGLRLAVDFAAAHRAAGREVLAHPGTRRELATAAALLLAGDAVALTTARGLHTLPAAQSLWSSVAKKVLTDTSEEALARCADVLGSRGVLRDGPYAAFDTLRRDNAVVRHIDTSPTANLRLVAAHFARLAAAPSATDADPGGADALPEALARTCTLDSPLPEPRLDRLELSDRGADPVLSAVPAVAADAREVLEKAGERRAARAVTRLERAVSWLAHALRARRGADPLRDQDLAARLCWVHAAASCLLLWWHNRDRRLCGAPAGDPGWLTAALTVLTARAAGRPGPLPEEDAEAVLAAVLPLHEADRLFSLAALPLAHGGPAPARGASA
ncbi:acyl-CoA dehydrogenase family protein [Streptomyces sp. HK10]|uniref:acyl-CoA dehydrogenase family protein n=1 Tax=Streptomyces sp. HK10 TaxID=3373255 RepID=UPI003748C096